MICCLCSYMQDPIYREHPNINRYDIRKQCMGNLCYDETLLLKFLNSPEVQAQLGVEKKWVDCSDKVN